MSNFSNYKANEKNYFLVCTKFLEYYCDETKIYKTKVEYKIKFEIEKFKTKN